MIIRRFLAPLLVIRPHCYKSLFNGESGAMEYQEQVIAPNISR